MLPGSWRRTGGRHVTMRSRHTIPVNTCRRWRLVHRDAGCLVGCCPSHILDTSQVHLRAGSVLHVLCTCFLCPHRHARLPPATAVQPRRPAHVDRQDDVSSNRSHISNCVIRTDNTTSAAAACGASGPAIRPPTRPDDISCASRSACVCCAAHQPSSSHDACIGCTRAHA